MIACSSDISSDIDYHNWVPATSPNKKQAVASRALQWSPPWSWFCYTERFQRHKWASHSIGDMSRRRACEFGGNVATKHSQRKTSFLHDSTVMTTMAVYSTETVIGCIDLMCNINWMVVDVMVYRNRVSQQSTKQEFGRFHVVVATTTILRCVCRRFRLGKTRNWSTMITSLMYRLYLGVLLCFWLSTTPLELIADAPCCTALTSYEFCKNHPFRFFWQV